MKATENLSLDTFAAQDGQWQMLNWRRIGMPKETVVIEGYISRTHWVRLRDSGGDFTMARIYKESELHHYFGDYPEDSARRVKITFEVDDIPYREGRGHG